MTAPTDTQRNHRRAVACHGTTVPPQGRKEVITGYGKKKIP